MELERQAETVERLTEGIQEIEVPSGEEIHKALTENESRNQGTYDQASSRIKAGFEEYTKLISDKLPRIIDNLLRKDEGGIKGLANIICETTILPTSLDGVFLNPDSLVTNRGLFRYFAITQDYTHWGTNREIDPEDSKSLAKSSYLEVKIEKGGGILIEFKFDPSTISLETITVRRRKSTGRADYREIFTARDSQEFTDQYLGKVIAELKESGDPILIHAPKALNDTSRGIMKSYDEKCRRGIINLGDTESTILESVEDARALEIY